MSLSTSELARLTGVTLRTIRHYHDIGVLPEPLRRSNGYKEYSISDLVTVLRIRRLSMLGFPLGRIAEMLADQNGLEADLLSSLDRELESQIEQLQAIRYEVSLARRHGTPPDVEPTAFRAAAGFGANQLRLGVLLSVAFSSDEREALASFVDSPPRDYDDLNADFATLDDHADKEEVARVTERLMQYLRDVESSDVHGAPGVLKDGLLGMNAPSQRMDISSQLLVEALLEDLNRTQRKVLVMILSQLSEPD